MGSEFSQRSAFGFSRIGRPRSVTGFFRPRPPRRESRNPDGHCECLRPKADSVAVSRDASRRNRTPKERRNWQKFNSQFVEEIASKLPPQNLSVFLINKRESLLPPRVLTCADKLNSLRKAAAKNPNSAAPPVPRVTSALASFVTCCSPTRALPARAPLPECTRRRDRESPTDAPFARIRSGGRHLRSPRASDADCSASLARRRSLSRFSPLLLRARALRAVPIVVP